MAKRPDLFPEELDEEIFTPRHFPAEALPLSDPRKAGIKLGQLLAFTAAIRGNNPSYVRGRETTRERRGHDDWEVVARGEPESNSGIYFHADMETRDAVLHLKNGYEVQLNSAPKEKRKTGSLYAVVDLAGSAVDESQWFTVRARRRAAHPGMGE